MPWDNDFIATYHGNKFWPMAAEGLLEIEEIAHSLSMLCRYNGHVTKFISVAEHCVTVARLVSREYALEGLLHDASEAYLGDLPTPIKRQLLGYREAEQKLDQRIATEFGTIFPFPDSVKEADQEALRMETALLMKFDFEADGYGKPTQDPKQWIRNWTPEIAEQAFLDTYDTHRRV